MNDGEFWKLQAYAKILKHWGWAIWEDQESSLIMENY